MIPKIVFRYSGIYDKFLRTRKKKQKDYPSRRKILNYIKKVEKIWRKDERKILREISKITRLEWKEKFIPCYIITEGDFSLSYPMTIVMYKKPDFFIDVLVHELIHRIGVPEENSQRFKKSWEYINRKYKNETFKTKIHIRIHAIHNHIYLKFYNEERLKRDIKWASKHRDYRRAWEIVQKEDYQNIIKELNKRIK